MDKTLQKYNLPKLNQEEAESLNRPITTRQIEAIIKKLPAHKIRGLECFTGEFYHSKNTYLSQTIPKNSRRRKTPNSLYEASIILIPKPGKHTTRKKITG